MLTWSSESLPHVITTLKWILKCLSHRMGHICIATWHQIRHAACSLKSGILLLGHCTYGHSVIKQDFFWGHTKRKKKKQQTKHQQKTPKHRKMSCGSKQQEGWPKYLQWTVQPFYLSLVKLKHINKKTEKMGRKGCQGAWWVGWFSSIWKGSWMFEIIFVRENYQVWSLPGHLKAKLVPALTWDGKKSHHHRSLCSSNSFAIQVVRSCLLTKCLLWCRDSWGTFACVQSWSPTAVDVLNAPRIHSSLSLLLLAQYCLPIDPSNLQSCSYISFLSSLAHGCTPTSAQLMWEQRGFPALPSRQTIFQEKTSQILKQSMKNFSI